MERRFDERPVGSIRWMQQAACAGMDTNFFFPEFGVSSNQYYEIKKVCAPCPVRMECIDYANRQNFDDGWFGGMSPDQRRRFSRAR